MNRLGICGIVGTSCEVWTSGSKKLVRLNICSENSDRMARNVLSLEKWVAGWKIRTNAFELCHG